MVQASVLSTFVASAGSTTLPYVAVPALVLACYIDARLAPVVPIAAIAYMAANGMTYDPVPAVAGALAGLAASPWALVATTLWAVIVATAIFTLATIEKPLWIAAVVAVVAALLMAAGTVWIHQWRPNSQTKVNNQDVETGETLPTTAPRRIPIETNLFL